MSREAHERELERHLSHVPAPAVRPEFRTTLRERFLAGAAAAPPVDVLPEDDRPRQASRAGGRRLAGWLALAAGIVAALFLFKPKPLVWQVLSGTTASLVRVNGDPHPLADPEELARALNDAHSVESVGGILRLAYGRQFALELAEGARVRFAQMGDSGGVDVHTMALEGLALRAVTGPEFPGSLLNLRSGEAQVTVRGTAIGIDRCPDGMCVCSLHGSVDVQRKDGERKPLAAGQQCWMPFASPAADLGTAHPDHLGAIEGLESSARASWQP